MSEQDFGFAFLSLLLNFSLGLAIALLFNDPLHPYTQGLIASLPQNSTPGMPLHTIPGTVPGLQQELPGCGFCDRCPDREWQCRTDRPPLQETGDGRLVACWKFS